MLTIHYAPMNPTPRPPSYPRPLNPPPCPQPLIGRPNVSCDHCGRWQWLDRSPDTEQAIELGWSLPSHNKAICPQCLRECENVSSTIWSFPVKEPEDGICRIYKATYARYRDLVPADVARKQARWERDGAVLRAFNAGTPYTVIAKTLGRWPHTIQYWCRKAGRRPYGVTSPIEQWMQQDDAEMRALVKFTSRLPRIRVTAPSIRTKT